MPDLALAATAPPAGGASSKRQSYVAIVAVPQHVVRAARVAAKAEMELRVSVALRRREPEQPRGLRVALRDALGLGV